ncbi:Hypothetical protein PHPALM_14498 [Phytophthora palmivora]|uniref:MULE transposase domain-containing protein n=1 Tax=Phytophthora palmivora TaxID=4796 RepID=A0A2P4XUM5_9STRA|nr:Hypothetical protein PHPALM_14498 [Phytophthora palmivora]
MRAFIEERLGEDALINPLDVFAWLIKKVDNGVFRGPPPKVSQVQAYVKRLCKNNKRDAMKPVLERCASHMYDISEKILLAGDRLVIVCDVKHENDMLVPNLGTGSSHSPFRIGLTCFTLLDDYVSIQRDPRCTTLFHIDSSHSIVKQRYPVFVFGVSDSYGKFFPLVYFCTSQRTGRAIWESFMVRFAPKFIMTDADNAQFTACLLISITRFEDSNVLVSHHISKTKLAPVTINMIFRDMNNLHFARTEEEYLSKRAHHPHFASHFTLLLITSYHNGYYTQDSHVDKRITPHQGVLQPTIPWSSTIVH